MVITLIGFRGTGKSSVGPLLAEGLGWGFVDADTAIESAAGMSIRQIFEKEGEAGFRRREAEVLVELLGQDRTVIAAGGGAVLCEANRMKMKQAGPVVWLRCPVETIVSRLAADAGTVSRRPSLTELPFEDEVRRLVAEREPVYRATAGLAVETAGRSPGEVAYEIHRQLERLAKGNEGQ